MVNIRILKIDGMDQVLALGNEKSVQDLYNTVEGMNMLLNNSAMQVLGKDDEYQQHTYTFSGISEVYDRFMMDVAGASGIPVTKLFGRSPAGMNSTGESDMENYFDTIEAAQEAQLRPIFDKLLPVIFTSTLGGVPDDLDFAFNPVRRANDMEKQDLGRKQTTAVIEAYTSGLIGRKTALKELQQSSLQTDMWTNITDSQVEEADDDVQGAGEDMFGMGEGLSPAINGDDSDDISNKAMDSEWNESEHPRDDNGRFGKLSSNEGEMPDDVSQVLGKELTGAKGREAINLLIKSKEGHIKDAYHRDDIGGITLVWGNNKLGISHILQSRKKRDGFTEEQFESFFDAIDEPIKKGTLSKNSRGTFEITFGDNMAIVSPELHNYKLNFLLTGFKIYK